MAEPRPTPYREVMLGAIFRPWRTSRTWWALAHLALDAPVGIIGFALTLPLLATSVGLIVIVPAAFVVSWLLFTVAHAVADAERSRFATLLGLPLVDASAPLVATTWARRHLERLRSAGRWKEIGYLLLRQPLGVAATALTAASWCSSLALITMPLVIPRLTDRRAHFWLFSASSGVGAWSLCALGIVGIAVVAPWVTVGLANADRAMGRWLLGRTERDELTERVSDLDHRRLAAVDSAEAERRRIERDLHDGAQQRLIAVAMDLGVARQRLDVDPDRASELVANAHDEVKAAITELRDLVRGIHPVILEDRGLDAAMSAVVARSPVPVRLRVDVSPRPAPAVESAAYFIVSEALVNVARHAAATSVSVEIVRHGDRLTLAVSDDGVGGADAERGTGLAGLADRVAALDGWMRVISPAGGPTTLLVELPCGS